MKRVRVQMVDAFVDGGRGGNAAGVVVDADDLSREERQLVAARVGVSETGFVSASKVAGFRLEFFTPMRQIAHCGHATVAAFSLLAASGHVAGSSTSKETIDGVRAIYLDSGRVFLEQSAPVYEEVRGIEVDRQLGLAREQVHPDFAPVVVSTANRFLLVPLRDRAAVQAAQPRLDAIRSTSEDRGLVGYYVFSLDAETAGNDAAARMFAPAYGIDEEPATGSAAGPLGAWLHDVAHLKWQAFTIEQGRLMAPPSPSILEVRLVLDGERIAAVRVGGRARVGGEREVTI